MTDRTSIPHQQRSSSKILIGTIRCDSQERITFLHEADMRPAQYKNMNKKSSFASIPNSSRTPATLMELKQQRLLAAADRKKRIIARVISMVGILIIILCAVIVTLTLKMAPKIDELVRTRAGKHHLFYHMSRLTTPSTTPIIESSNFTNTTSISTLPYHA